ncbi:nicotinate-nucleotide adenylyltransferase [Glaciecola punicea ACAM 611]|jgi:nicotinate (nicotinamide) nucleotide adenylyltransferase|uniref:Probable nicotinate-nucleotide adenylyltransferase n=1 Tax=Glaciecola punicea ACAM 611 TaxID=1121923 RepID=H5TAC3_9ALTE|nr:nicotinate (nicotinamide) nucleotide adenylyltransferase [Glaciecola punicea]OFA33515.1 nicotinate (nicotinamide) nucleotide adenylyltransferase [Glaciecola punicea]GAB55250.1 nicotinate-nucleotide adenylyltransferase [Glaciecola punicea ACAM 611]
MDKNINKPAINALFGGTFDPPHFGHLLPLTEIADIAGLSTISLLPANVPVFKKEVTSAEHRIAMTQLLCDIDARFSLDLTEFSRAEVSYTIDTLSYLKEQNPAQPIVFIIGLDSLLTLHLWERWQQLFDFCHIIVMQRSPLDASNSTKATDGEVSSKMASKLYNFYTSKQEFEHIVGPDIDKNLKIFLLSTLATAENGTQCINYDAFKDIIETSAIGKLWFIKNQILPLSSTHIRQHIKAGKDISNMLPTAILNYISVHKLYNN